MFSRLVIYVLYVPKLMKKIIVLNIYHTTWLYVYIAYCLYIQYGLTFYTILIGTWFFITKFS